MFLESNGTPRRGPAISICSPPTAIIGIFLIAFGTWARVIRRARCRRDTPPRGDREGAGGVTMTRIAGGQPRRRRRRELPLLGAMLDDRRT